MKRVLAFIIFCLVAFAFFASRVSSSNAQVNSQCLGFDGRVFLTNPASIWPGGTVRVSCAGRPPVCSGASTDLTPSFSGTNYSLSNCNCQVSPCLSYTLTGAAAGVCSISYSSGTCGTNGQTIGGQLASVDCPTPTPTTVTPTPSPPPLPRYSCVGASCVSNPSGLYTASDCNSNCNRYSCSSGSCVLTEGGQFSDPSCGPGCIVPPVCNSSFGTCGCSSGCRDGVNTDFSCCRRVWSACGGGSQTCFTVFGSGSNQCSPDGATQSCGGVTPSVPTPTTPLACLGSGSSCPDPLGRQCCSGTSCRGGSCRGISPPPPFCEFTALGTPKQITPGYDTSGNPSTIPNWTAAQPRYRDVDFIFNWNDGPPVRPGGGACSGSGRSFQISVGVCQDGVTVFDPSKCSTSPYYTERTPNTKSWGQSSTWVESTAPGTARFTIPAGHVNFGSIDDWVPRAACWNGSGFNCDPSEYPPAFQGAQVRTYWYQIRADCACDGFFDPKFSPIWVFTYDYAVSPVSSISGYVFNDPDRDGVFQNPPETGVANQTVFLTDTTITQTTQATTDSNGHYLFKGMQQGHNYTVGYTAPPGYIQTTPSSVVISNFSSSQTVNFGIAFPAISGTVFVDTNENGVRDPGEAGMPGVTITATDLSAGGSQTRATDGSGNYTFTTLTPFHDYQISITTPPGYFNTTPAVRYVYALSADTTVQFGIAQFQTISGLVFVDLNKNRIRDPGEPVWTGGGFTITAVSGTTGLPTGTVTYNYPAGSYTISGLSPGSYFVTMSGLPPGYFFTNPPAGAGGAFTVTVGFSICNPGTSNSAYCLAGNIFELDYGISNLFPWNQCLGSDCRVDNGYTTKIPQTAGGGGNSACVGPYAEVPNGPNNQGIVFTGATTPDFGNGSASVPNWIVGGAPPVPQEVYSPSSGIIPVSYSYYSSLVASSGLPTTPLSIVQCGAGGTGACDLSSSNLPDGIYVLNGDLTLTTGGGSYTFPPSKKFVFLIKGHLTIRTKIAVPVGSIALFATTDDIKIDRSVGESTINTADPLTASVQGVFVTNRNFVIDGINSCLVGADTRLNIAGTVIANASQQGLGVVNFRDLCAGDAYCPAYSFISRPDFILNAPDFFKKSGSVWQEVVP